MAHVIFFLLRNSSFLLRTICLDKQTQSFYDARYFLSVHKKNIETDPIFGISRCDNPSRYYDSKFVTNFVSTHSINFIQNFMSILLSFRPKNNSWASDKIFRGFSIFTSSDEFEYLLERIKNCINCINLLHT